MSPLYLLPHLPWPTFLPLALPVGNTAFIAISDENVQQPPGEEERQAEERGAVRNQCQEVGAEGERDPEVGAGDASFAVSGPLTLLKRLGIDMPVVGRFLPARLRNSASGGGAQQEVQPDHREMALPQFAEAENVSDMSPEARVEEDRKKKS
ncbi:hypothetical protein IAR50_006835 [Cryptococcus sp. DSM 104548]